MKIKLFRFFDLIQIIQIQLVVLEDLVGIQKYNWLLSYYMMEIATQHLGDDPFTRF